MRHQISLHCTDTLVTSSERLFSVLIRRVLLDTSKASKHMLGVAHFQGQH